MFAGIVLAVLATAIGQNLVLLSRDGKPTQTRGLSQISHGYLSLPRHDQQCNVPVSVARCQTDTKSSEDTVITCQSMQHRCWMLLISYWSLSCADCWPLQARVWPLTTSESGDGRTPAFKLIVQMIEAFQASAHGRLRARGYQGGNRVDLLQSSVRISTLCSPCPSCLHQGAMSEVQP